MYTHVITGSCEQTYSFYVSLGHAIQQQRLRSSPWSGALRADIPTYAISGGRNVFFTDTGDGHTRVVSSVPCARLKQQAMPWYDMVWYYSILHYIILQHVILYTQYDVECSMLCYDFSRWNPAGPCLRGWRNATGAVLLDWANTIRRGFQPYV